MNPTKLANTVILAVAAETLVNGKPNTSRFTNEEFRLGNIVFEREDGIFFENILFENDEWRPFFRFETNNFELSNMNNEKSCGIVITQYEPK